MPTHVRFMLRHAGIGFVLAAATVAGMLWLDVAHLRALTLGTAHGPLGLALLTFFMGLTFGSVQIGAAVMLTSDDDRPRGHGRRVAAIAAPSTLRVLGRRR